MSKSILDKIKGLFSAEEAPVEAKFKDAKLVDGTIVRVEGDEFKVGDKLSFITEDGTIVDAKEGMHELEDGTILVVDAESKITEIRATTPEAEEVESEMSAVQLALEAVGPNAYIELPVGVHIIAGSTYTVEEVLHNAGLENEYKCNVIVSIVPEGGEVAAEEVIETVETEMSEVISIEDRMANLETALTTLVEGLSAKNAVVETQLSEVKLENEELKKAPIVKSRNFKKAELKATEGTELKMTNNPTLDRIIKLKEKNNIK